MTSDEKGAYSAYTRIAREADPLLTGRELEQLSPEQLQEQVANIPVYARVTPERRAPAGKKGKGDGKKKADKGLTMKDLRAWFDE